LSTRNEILSTRNEVYFPAVAGGGTYKNEEVTLKSG
jgi:hypothetical protein